MVKRCSFFPKMLVNDSISNLNYWENHSPSAFSWGKRWWYSPYCPLNWLISWTPILSLFNFKWTFSEAIWRRAVSSLVSSIIATGLLSAPIIGLHPKIPTCRQAAGRLVPTVRIRIWTWICLHYMRTLTAANFPRNQMCYETYGICSWVFWNILCCNTRSIHSLTLWLNKESSVILTIHD